MSISCAGISALLFYSVLKERHAEELLAKLNKRKGLVERDNPRVDTHEYVSYLFQENGIVLTLSKFHDSPWGFYVYLSPAAVLGDNAHGGLFMADKKSYKELRKTVDKMLKKVCSPRLLEDMELSRVSLSAVLEPSKAREIPAYLSVIRHGFESRHYTVAPLRDDETLATAGYVRKHSYRQCCKTTTFIACDAEGFKNLDHPVPPEKLEKHALILQVRLRRKAIRRRLKRKEVSGHGEALAYLSEQAESVIGQQLTRMKLHTGQYLPYDDATEKVSDKIGDRKARERMLYLLKEARKQGSLTFAIKHLKQEFDLNNRKVSRIFKKFAKLNLSPVTLPDQSKQLPGFTELFAK